MEKTCEFCGAPQPVVYCQADAAVLCLSCDSKVHSANALFGRHSRTLLCDACKQNPAHVRCLDHSMLLCQQCDSRLHKTFSPHKKLMIGSFTGCPSAMHFAALWGFDVNQLDHFSAALDSSAISSESEFGSCSLQHTKLGNQRQQNNSLIMHQILDLKNLQLTEGDDNHTKPLRDKGKYATSSSMINENLEQQRKEKELNCLTNELESLANPNQVLKEERFPSPISQLDHISSSSSVGDPFWQYKSPVDNNNQFWSQNLQDLGMCQELGCFDDDFNIPDVDVTFRNFEDLLTGDPDLTRALLEDHDPMLSDIDKASMNKFEISLIETIQEANLASVHDARGLSRNVENSHPPHLIRFSRSATFSGSRLSAESSGSDFVDSGNSGYFMRGESSNNVAELLGVDTEGDECSIRISKEKKKTRLHGKKPQLAPRKAKADMHKKIKSRCAKVQGYESDPANVTKSY